MPALPKYFCSWFKQATTQPPNLLNQRLQDALQQGRKVQIETSGDAFAGIPIHLDSEFVELFVLSTPVGEEEEEPPYTRNTWLIRLSCVEAVSYCYESWSKERLERLLAEDGEKGDTQTRTQEDTGA